MLAPKDRRALLDALTADALDRANALLAHLPGLERVRVERVENARAAEAAPVWRGEPDGTSRFRFHARSWGPHAGLIFGRWLDMLPLVTAVMAHRPVGWVSLNLGDEGHRPGLAPCDHRAGYTLVPDYMFLATHGYAALGQRFAGSAMRWGDRAPVLFWRGATSGIASHVEALPRVRLCRIARTLGDQADVGLSAVTPEYAADEARLRADGLLRPFVPPERLERYRLHLDIDGNSNSWPGLFTKLLSGGAVLKVESPYRQWYYHRLEPWVTHVPIRADMADLAEVARELLAAPKRAEAIGRAGQALALSLTVEREIARAVPAVLAAFRRD